MGKELGFNIRFKFQDKLVAGTTTDDFNIEGVTKESIMKSDEGSTQKENIGRTVAGSTTLYLLYDASASLLTIDDLRQAAAANSTGTYEYGGTTAGRPLVTGTARALRISESSNSEDYATATFDWEEVEGTGGFGTQS